MASAVSRAPANHPKYEEIKALLCALGDTVCLYTAQNCPPPASRKFKTPA
jgi:hypothetical protein